MRVVDASPFPLTDAGLVKMEDRKRPASYDYNDSAPPLKKQATSINGGSKSHSDADMPWKDDIERFQKEAIFRQMQEYKREKNTLESRLNDLIKRTKDHDDHLRAIDGWFKQLIDEVRILTQSSSSLPPDTKQSSFPSSLLFADNVTFNAHLQRRSHEIKTTISTLFANSTNAPPQLTELQARLTSLLAEEKVRIAELEQAHVEKDAMQAQLETATFRYLSAEKKLDRAKSMTVAKLEKQAIMVSQKDSGSAAGDDAPPDTKDDAAVNGVAEKANDNAELREEHRRVVAASSKQKEQLEKLAADNEKLTQQITALTLKTTRLSDEDYASTDLFKLVKSQHEDIIKRINHLEATNIQLREEAKKLQAERTKYRVKIESESQAAVSEKELQLTKAENDLVRIRNARDELASDLSRKKAVEEQEKAFATKMKELNGAHEARINALESEAERLRLQLGQSDSPTASNLDELAPEELRSKYHVLEQSSSMLNGEVASMTTALKKTSALASQKVAETGAYEEKLQRLAAEKSKAIEKYFTAMKLKESRDLEVRTLKLQNAKASDVVSQLKEAEAEARNLVVNCEKQLVEAKDALTSITSQHRALQQQIAEGNIAAEGYKSQISKLEKVMVERDASLAFTSNSLRQAEVEVEELKVTLLDTQKALETAKLRTSGGKNSEQDFFRSLVICTVCKLNVKNTLLKTCGHIFCKDCVQERIDSRSRKCPNCHKSYGLNDHMRVTL